MRNDPDNHDGVITQRARHPRMQTKLVEVMEFQLNYFKS